MRLWRELGRSSVWGALVGFGLRPGVDVGAVRCMRGLGLGFRHSLHRIEGEKMGVRVWWLG